jgi:hypothetical protein
MLPIREERVVVHLEQTLIPKSPLLVEHVKLHFDGVKAPTKRRTLRQQASLAESTAPTAPIGGEGGDQTVVVQINEFKLLRTVD